MKGRGQAERAEANEWGGWKKGRKEERTRSLRGTG